MAEAVTPLSISALNNAMWVNPLRAFFLTEFCFIPHLVH
ncbi:hypothetical protein YPPY60_3459 [Yersinia pestis PY-60]|nr:hypothetical protein YPPY60_3459 [Yersinia pestis PY-60]